MATVAPTFVCIHGTTHTAKEFEKAAAWADKVYRYGTLDETGEICWVLAWRREGK